MSWLACIVGRKLGDMTIHSSIIHPWNNSPPGKFIPETIHPQNNSPPSIFLNPTSLAPNSGVTYEEPTNHSCSTP